MEVTGIWVNYIDVLRRRQFSALLPRRWPSASAASSSLCDPRYPQIRLRIDATNKFVDIAIDDLCEQYSGMK